VVDLLNFLMLQYSMLLVHEVYQYQMMIVMVVMGMSRNEQLMNQVAVVLVVLMVLMDVFDLLEFDFHYLSIHD
jgi:hypothetical protein